MLKCGTPDSNTDILGPMEGQHASKKDGITCDGVAVIQCCIRDSRQPSVHIGSQAEFWRSSGLGMRLERRRVYQYSPSGRDLYINVVQPTLPWTVRPLITDCSVRVSERDYCNTGWYMYNTVSLSMVSCVQVQGVCVGISYRRRLITAQKFVEVLVFTWLSRPKQVSHKSMKLVPTRYVCPRSQSMHCRTSLGTRLLQNATSHRPR